MKQTMLLKLQPTPEQHRALLQTMHAFNAACTATAELAFALKSANKFELQRQVYIRLRAEFGLPAQLAIRAISKVSEAYKRDKSIQPTFRPEGAIVYDQRVMSFQGLLRVSLLTLQGRALIPFLIGAYQQARLDAIVGQADLLFREGVFSLAVTIDQPAPPANQPQGTLGVDLGIVNLATDSDGEAFSGAPVEQVRQRILQLRAFLSYKAALAGVCLHLVDPRNTSRICSVCGHCEKANRKSQAEFVCQSCGFAAPADWNAAVNISRAEVKQPIVAPAA